SPGHPIAEGVPHPFVIPQQEMYGEFFDIPQPDELVFISSFAGGEVFRSGCCFTRGRGRIFYFSPGHEFYPVYHQAEVQRVLANAVGWAAPGEPRQRSPFQSEKKLMGWFTEPLATAPEAWRGVTMRGLYVDRPQHVVIKEVDEPELGADEVRIRAELATIKHGTDFHIFSGTSPFQDRDFDLTQRLFVKRADEDVRERHLHRFIGNTVVGVVSEVGS